MGKPEVELQIISHCNCHKQTSVQKEQETSNMENGVFPL